MNKSRIKSMLFNRLNDSEQIDDDVDDDDDEREDTDDECKVK